MKRKQILRIQQLIHETAHELALVRDIVLHAPGIVKYHTDFLSHTFTKVECKLVAANNCIIKGGSV